MKKLIQKKNFIKSEFRTSETKLFYTISKFGNTDEVDISFENITGEKVSVKRSNNIFLLISIFIYIISIALLIGKMKGSKNIEEYAWVFWGVIATIVLGYYWFSREDLWKINLSNNSSILIHKAIPSNNKVLSFINNLIQERDTYLKENYAFVDKNLDYREQLANYKWLKSINVISKSEFDKIYTELKKTVTPDKPNIGFNN